MVTMLPLMLAFAIAAAPGHAHRTKLAVLDVEDVSGTEAAKAKLITQVLVGELPKQGHFEVLGASEIRSMIGFARQKELLGCHEDSCLAELGGAMGVDYLVVGQLGKLGSRYRFDLRLINAQKSKVVASEGDFVAGNDDALADAVVKMERALLVDGKLIEAPNLASVPDNSPAGGLTQTAPSSPSRSGAWIVGGVGLALAAGATVMTIVAHNRFTDDQACYASSTSPQRASLAASQTCKDAFSPNTYSYLADALWGGTLVAAGVSTYLFLRTPNGAGAGGEIGIKGSF